MSKHTKEPWQVSFNEEDCSHEISMDTAIDNECQYRTHHLIKYSHGLYPDTAVPIRHSQFEEAEANATRIVACVNALAGIDDPAAFVANHAKLVSLINEAHREVGSGFDMLASATWDHIVETANALSDRGGE